MRNTLQDREMHRLSVQRTKEREDVETRALALFSGDAELSTQDAAGPLRIVDNERVRRVFARLEGRGLLTSRLRQDVGYTRRVWRRAA